MKILLTLKSVPFQSLSSGLRKEVVSVEDMGDYEIRHELLRLGNEKPVPTVSYYAKDGSYIGDEKIAKYILAKGIAPQKANPDDTVASIGYCAREGLWYGWSHRAIHGFKVGDSVKQGDCAYLPPNDREAILEDARNFWGNEQHHILELDGDNLVQWSPDYKKLRAIYGGNFFHEWTDDDWSDNFGDLNKASIWRMLKQQGYMRRTDTPLVDIPTGRGAWTAETEDDAKQMAIDFAASVSSSLEVEVSLPLHKSTSRSYRETQYKH